LALFFPGILLLQWASTALGLYDDMTLTDGCLVMIVILLCVLLLRGGLHGGAAEQRDAGLAGPSSGKPRPRRPHGRTQP